MKKAVVFNSVDYPIGSWSQQIRMIHKGMYHNGIYLKLIVTFPAPDNICVSNSEDFVYFCLNSVEKKRGRDLFSIFYKILGTIKGYRELKNDPDIEFILLPHLDLLHGLFVKRFSKKYNIKMIALIGDENGKIYSDEKLNFIETLAKYNQLLYEKYILKQTDRIFVVSSYLKDKYSKKFNNKNIELTVPSVIDLDYYKEIENNDMNEILNVDLKNFITEESIKIVYAGACNRTNGIEFFLKAYSELIFENELPDSSVHMFFSYGDIDRIKHLCKEYRIQERINLYPAILPKYIPAIYKNADILILPEHGSIIANAGFPGKTAEYLASGKAIISTNFSDLRRYLKNGYNCMISEIGDEATYKKNLKKLITDKNFREYLGNNAFTTAQSEFNAKEAVKIYLKN